MLRIFSHRCQNQPLYSLHLGGCFISWKEYVLERGYNWFTPVLMIFLSLVRAGSWGGGWSEHPTQDRKLDEKEEERSLRNTLDQNYNPPSWLISSVSGGFPPYQKSLNLGRQFLFGKKRKQTQYSMTYLIIKHNVLTPTESLMYITKHGMNDGISAYISRQILSRPHWKAMWPE